MEKLLLASLCCFGGILQSEGVDWCALPCGDGEPNTLCKYKPQTNAGSCTNIVVATDGAMRKKLLDLHNDYRNRLAKGEMVSNGVAWPKASDMRQMRWDQDLERLALRWVQQCSDSPPHDKCRRTPAFSYNGQNKGWAGHSSEFPTPYGSFEGWVGEIAKASPAIVDNLGNNAEILHFTQVIWAQSYQLGCAAVHADKKGFKTTIVVCNYGPGGNILGTKIYTRGDPCKNCPPQTSCASGSALCASEEDKRASGDIPDLPKGGSCKPILFGMRLDQPRTLVAAVIFTFLTIKTT